MKSENLRLKGVYVEHTAYREFIEIHLIAEDTCDITKNKGKPFWERYHLGPEGWEHIPPEMCHGIGLPIPTEAAQQLVNSLWEVGIRPSAAKGSAGQLSAVQYHLEDMRKIAFKNV